MVHVVVLLVVLAASGLQARWWRRGRPAWVAASMVVVVPLWAELVAEAYLWVEPWTERPLPQPDRKAGVPGGGLPVSVGFSPDGPVAWPRSSDDPALRVLFLGDSFTYGSGVDDDAVFGRVAARSLATSARPVDAVVHGFPGADLADELTMLLDVGLSWEPDIVVWVVIANDLGDPGLAVDLVQVQPNRDHWLATMELAQRARRAAAVGQEAHRFYVDRASDAVVRQRAQALFEAAVAVTAATETPLVVAYHPLLVDPEAFPMGSVRDGILAAADAAGAHTVDLTPALQDVPLRTLWVHPRDQHPNAAGHARVGRHLAEALRPLSSSRRIGDGCDALAAPTPVDLAPEHPSLRVAACAHPTEQTYGALESLHADMAGDDPRARAVAIMLGLLREHLR